ncbi:MAG: hypothetical protein L6Q69_21590 [Zoogloea sp.]|nr:hypothetical protein [Zoogloea sp.]
MKLKHIPVAVLQAVRARSSRIRLHPAAVNAELENVFGGLVRDFLVDPLGLCNPAARLVLAALATEGIGLLQEAQALVKALHTAVSDGAVVYVAFDGVFKRPRCVQLSPVTLRLLGEVQDLKCLETDASADLEQWVKGHLPALSTDIAALDNSPLELLESAALAFWMKHLPGALFNDTVAAISIAPLPLPALARRASKRPLQRIATTDPTLDGIQARAAQLMNLATERQQLASADLIRSILSRTQVGGAGKHRRKQLEDIAAYVERWENDLDGLFLCFFAAGLLTIGTVRTETPSVSILGRYFNAIDAVVSTSPNFPQTVTSLSGAERGRLFQRLIDTAKEPGDMSAALSALDMYLVIHYDVEPALVKSSRWEFHAMADAQILWTHESRSIATSIDRAARTPTQAWVAKVLVELMAIRSMRPSDLMHATLIDLHFYSDDHVVFDIRRHRGQPGHKTEAAEHPLEFKDARCEIPLTIAYYNEVCGKGRSWSDPFWGETWEESRRNFLDGWSLVNQLAKAWTGDPRASIYAFRHTWFSVQLEEALQPEAAAQDPGRVHRIARDGGHLDPTTAIVWYFHLPLSAVRANADLALESLLDAKTASRWTALSIDAIYKRVSRAPGRFETPLVHAIRDGLDCSRFRAIGEAFPCQPEAAVSLRRAEVKFSDVMTATAFVDAHRAWWREEGCTGPLNDFERTIASLRRDLLGPHKSAVLQVNMDQDKLQPLARYLTNHGTSQMVRRACQAFTRGEFDGYIDIAKHEDLLIWLDLLKSSGTPLTRIVVRMVAPLPNDVADMENRFAAAALIKPHIEGVPGGHKRPRAYLQLSSLDPGPKKAVESSAVHMGGFCSLMTVACIRLKLIDAAPEDRETEA